MSDNATVGTTEAGARTSVLPADGLNGTLVGRIWRDGPVPGPAVVVLRPEGVFDLSAHYPTMSSLLESDDPVAAVRACAASAGEARW